MKHEKHQNLSCGFSFKTVQRWRSKAEHNNYFIFIRSVFLVFMTMFR